MNPGTARPRYGNPFDGSPMPIVFSGLFLFEPELDLKLLGPSLRGLFDTPELASLWSGMQRNIRNNAKPTPRLKNQMLSLLPASTLRDLLEAALEGDQLAASRLIATGPWEGAALALESATPARPRKYVLDFLLGIERAGAKPAALIRGGRFTEAAEVLALDPVLSQLLWPRALDALKRCSDSKMLPFWRTSVAMEVRLSMLAALVLEPQPSVPQLSCPKREVSILLPSIEDSSYTPFRRLFQWLVKELGETTIPQLQKLLDREGADVGLDTLYRWSDGTRQLDRETAEKVAIALPTEEKKEEFRALFDACRHLHLLGYIARVCCEEAKKQTDQTTSDGVTLWPGFPFGHESFEAWCVDRYPIWLEFHRRQLALRAVGNSSL